jgi:carboxymethylenebutenolidase
MSIRTEKVQIPVEGEAKPMQGYLAVPEGPGPFPAVIVIEEIFGVNAHIRDVTERVAREGYVAIAPDIHHRETQPGWELPYDESGMKQGMALIPKLSADGAIADLTGTINFLRARKEVKGDAIGCMGFCIGGHVAYLAAVATDVKATASFYGGGVASYGLGAPQPTVTRSGEIKGRILCLFGGKDSMISAEQVETVKKALAAGHVRHEVVVYPDCSHAFFRDAAPAVYHKASAEDAWKRVKALFAEELR